VLATSQRVLLTLPRVRSAVLLTLPKVPLVVLAIWPAESLGLLMLPRVRSAVLLTLPRVPSVACLVPPQPLVVLPGPLALRVESPERLPMRRREPSVGPLLLLQVLLTAPPVPPRA
jgi:hypothetical protein